MDKKVVLAVAGAGKTKFIVDKLSLSERALLITYTDNNLATLRFRITNKFGYIPENIKLFSYFTFLHSFAYKPFLSDKKKAKGINWELPPQWTRNVPRHDDRFYLDGMRRLYTHHV
jgi:ABC-type uncharacterized transport system ATPase subunit